MSNAKSTSRSLYIDQSSAELALDRLTKKMKALETEIAKGTLQGDKLTKKIQELNGTKADVEALQDQIKKGLAPTLLQAQNQVTQLRNELRRMSSDAPGFADKFKAYKKASSTLEELRQKVDGVKESHSAFGKVF